MSKFSNIISTLFKISLIVLTILAVIASITGVIVYTKTDEYKIKSLIGEVYAFETEYNNINFMGASKIISKDKLSLTIMIHPNEGYLINNKINNTLFFKLFDKDDFPVGEFNVSDFVITGYDSEIQMVSGLTFENVINIDYELKNSLIKTTEIKASSFRGFETVSLSDLQKNKEKKEAAQREAAQREAAQRQREAAQRQREAAQKEAAQREAALWLDAYKKNWRALQKGMNPSSVTYLLGSPNHISSGNFPIYTYSETVNNRTYRGTVTFYKGVVYSWDEPRF